MSKAGDMDDEPRPARELLGAAQAILERPAEPDESWVERAAAIKEIARQLDQHGVDGISLIRFGLSHLFAAPVLGSVAVAIFLESRGEGLQEEAPLIDISGWRRALGVAPDRSIAAADLAEALRHVSQMIEGWIAWAPVETLVRLTPVSSEQLAEWCAAVDASIRSAADVYRWLVERTLEAELDNWSTASFKREYRYSVLGEAPQAPEHFLDIAQCQPDRLAHALAVRILKEEAKHEESGWFELLAAVQKQARMLLRQGRCVEAAALFEFLISHYPSDPTLRNNLAFCLVTSSPEQASEHFRDAQRMGFAPKSLLLYNRACCATTDALKREVLFESNHHWLDELEPVPVGAFIWRWIDGAFAPVQTPDVRMDLAQEAAGLALELGDLARVPDWKSRLADLQQTRDSISATGNSEEARSAVLGENDVPRHGRTAVSTVSVASSAAPSHPPETEEFLP